MKAAKLTSRLRDGTGKKTAHKLRAAGEVPAILYGHKEEALALAIPEHEIWHILHNATSEHLILSLDIDGVPEDNVLILVRDVQHEPVSGDILHIDFQRISMNEKIKVGVPVELVGVPRGVKEFGGVLDHGMREIMVRCTPAEIPESLRVDVTHLEIGQSVHQSDVVDDYRELEFLDDSNYTLAHVSPPKKLEVFEAEAEAAEAAAEGEEEEEAAEEGEAAGEKEES